MLAGLWKRPGSPDLKVERTLSSERIRTGDIVQVSLKVHNPGSLKEEVLLEDRLPAGLEVVDGSARRLVRMPPGSTITWSYAIKGRRGYYNLQHLHVSINETLGLSGLYASLPTDGHLFIQPPVLHLRRVAIQPRRTRIYSGTIPARQGGPGVEFFGVREYQAGDPPRRINWKLTARHPQHAFSNEYEQERAADVGLILDGRQRANEFNGRSLFEKSILATAALADSFLNAGNRVGVFFYGSRITWTMPGYGKLQSERILHDLSTVETGDSQNFSELYIPRHLFPSRSQLVVISPLLLEDIDPLMTLRMRGFQVLVISPDPVGFEGQDHPGLKEYGLGMRIVRLQRALLMRRLRAAGIRMVDWDTTQPFEAVAKRDLEQRVVYRQQGAG
jgi:uncharacterized protein (DUF58 family)